MRRHPNRSPRGHSHICTHRVLPRTRTPGQLTRVQTSEPRQEDEGWRGSCACRREAATGQGQQPSVCECNMTGAQDGRSSAHNEDLAASHSPRNGDATMPTATGRCHFHCHLFIVGRRPLHVTLTRRVHRWSVCSRHPPLLPPRSVHGETTARQIVSGTATVNSLHQGYFPTVAPCPPLTRSFSGARLCPRLQGHACPCSAREARLADPNAVTRSPNCPQTSPLWIVGTDVAVRLSGGRGVSCGSGSAVVWFERKTSVSLGSGSVTRHGGI